MPRKTNEKKTARREKKRAPTRKKACRFCVDKDISIDYKLAAQLTHFLSERGKLVPRRITGNCSYHQREIVTAVNRARLLAFLPFSVTHSNL